jgi:hypothetical protein
MVVPRVAGLGARDDWLLRGNGSRERRGVWRHVADPALLLVFEEIVASVRIVRRRVARAAVPIVARVPVAIGSPAGIGRQAIRIAAREAASSDVATTRCGSAGCAGCGSAGRGSAG